MTVVCAWCQALMRAGGEAVSHGICDDCSWQMETRLLRELGRPIPGTLRRKARASAASAPLPGFDV